MNVIECIYCGNKYNLKLHSIPKKQKSLLCVKCSKNTPLPFYSEAEQKFQISVDAFCDNCDNNYSIPSSKFTSPKMKVVCSTCKNKFELYFSNFKNLQKMNQKISAYINKDESEIFHNKNDSLKEKEKKELKNFINNVSESTTEKEANNENPSNKQNNLPTQGKDDEKSHNFENNKEEKEDIENYENWEKNLMNKEASVQESLRSRIFLSKKKSTKFDSSDLPSLIPEQDSSSELTKKTNSKSKTNKQHFFVSIIIFSLFLLVVVFYIFLIQ